MSDSSKATQLVEAGTGLLTRGSLGWILSLHLSEPPFPGWRNGGGVRWGWLLDGGVGLRLEGWVGLKGRCVLLSGQ